MKPKRVPCAGLMLAAVTLLLAGCTTYEVKLDAIARTAGPAPETPAPVKVAQAAAGSYWISSGNPHVRAEDLRFQEAAGHIRTALSAHGLWAAPTPASADMFVELDYGLGSPQTIETKHREPVYGAADEAETQLIPQLPGIDNRAPMSGNAETDNAVVGFATTLSRTTVYEKRLCVTCREAKSPDGAKPPVELWTVSASIEDASSNLREYLPILAAAVMVKLGTTTNGMETNALKTNDDAVTFVKAGM